MSTVSNKLYLFAFFTCQCKSNVVRDNERYLLFFLAVTAPCTKYTVNENLYIFLTLCISIFNMTIKSIISVNIINRCTL
jgi:hypothetical protein